MIEHRMLRNFLAVIDQGSFVRAAETVGITQSGLTQSIAKLESLLSVSLLERGRFGASPTEAGSLFAERARVIVAELANAMSDVAGLRDGSHGRVAIGVGASLVGGEFVDGLDAFLRRRKDVLLTVLEGASPDLLPRLAAGELDAVFCQPDPTTRIGSDFIAEVVSTHVEGVLVGETHPLAASRSVTLEELLPYYWCIPPAGNRRLRYIRDVFAENSLPPPAKIIRTNSMAVGFELVRRGIAIVVSDPSRVSGDVRSGRIRLIDCPPLREQRTALLILRGRSSQSSALRVLLKDLKTALNRPMNAAASVAPF